MTEEKTPDLELGSIVVLNSGGHLMTIVSMGCCVLGVSYSDGMRLEGEEIPRSCLRLACAEEIAAAKRVLDFPF